MTTLANALALLGLAFIRLGGRWAGRWGGRGAGGLIWMFFGLAIVAVLVWALTRPARPDISRH